MSTLATLLTDLSTYISQSSTSNLSDIQRIRYLNISRAACANAHDWTFLYKESVLDVTLKTSNEIYSTASLPSDLKNNKIRMIYYGPNQTEYWSVDEHDFKSEGENRMYTIGRSGTTNELWLRGVEGADGDSDLFLASQATSSSSTTAVTSFLSSPDVPRQILFTPGGTTGDIAAGNIVVVGRNDLGEITTENVAITANMTSTVVTTNHYSAITSITFPQMDGNGATFDVGTNSVVGLRISYLYQLTDYSSSDTSATSGFPDDADEAIVLGAVYRIFMKFARERTQYADFKQEYVDQIALLWSKYGKENKSTRTRIKNIRELTYQPIASTQYAS